MAPENGFVYKEIPFKLLETIIFMFHVKFWQGTVCLHNFYAKIMLDAGVANPLKVQQSKKALHPPIMEVEHDLLLLEIPWIPNIQGGVPNHVQYANTHIYTYIYVYIYIHLHVY